MLLSFYHIARQQKYRIYILGYIDILRKLFVAGILSKTTRSINRIIDIE